MSIGFAQEKPFPRLWPSLGMIILYFVLQIIVSAVVVFIYAAANPELMGALKQGMGLRPEAIAMPAIWGILISALIMALIIVKSIRKHGASQAVGLEGDQPNAFWNALPLGLGLLAAITFFNWAYATYIFPDIEMQAGIAELIQGMASNPFNLLIGVITIAGVVPFVEELLFRGLLQNALMKTMPPIAAIAVAAFLFSIVHMQVYAIPPLFLLGFAFGYLYWKTGSLKTNIGLHMLNNAAATALTLYAA